VNEIIPVYAIRVKGTDQYLPERKRGRGYSWDEPVSLKDVPPRFYFSRKSAEASLRQWLRGKHVMHRGGGQLGWDGVEDYYEDIEIVPQPNRVAADMEIVYFEAIECPHG
jgi:hypothetical protein